MTIRQHGELVVISGPCRGNRITISLDSMKIGRDRTCEIHLDDEAASRAHSEILWRGSQYILRDLKSTNGTFLNDARVNEILLQNGDRIGIGDSVLQIQIPHQPDSRSPQIVFTQDEHIVDGGSNLNVDGTSFLEWKDGIAVEDVQEQFARLHEFNAEISGILHPPALLERALARMFETFPIERGAILLMT
ncbi:MAG: FHA domain-containing protein, partial [Planctomycetota bacterium]